MALDEAGTTAILPEVRVDSAVAGVAVPAQARLASPRSPASNGAPM
jgi:hypothetical protein